MPRQVVFAYQQRWPVEQINRELKTDLGMGEHQVQCRRRADREVLWHSGAGVFVSDPCLPSGDSPGDIVEHCTTAACVALTHHHESGRAQCENAADKSPQSSLIACFRPWCHFCQNQERNELHYTNVYKWHHRWSKDGSYQALFEASIVHLQSKGSTRHVNLHGDGSNTVVKKGARASATLP